MEIKYFPDTDTLRIDFARREIADTRKINEDILIAFDNDGHLVNMTIAHARQQMDIEQISYERVAQAMHSVHTLVINHRGGHAYTHSESRSL